MPLRRTLLIPVTTLAVLTGTAAPAMAAPECDDACKVDGARAYVAALADHDPSEVPFHPEATRVEAGLPTGFSGDQMRADLRFGPQYRVIRGISEESYTVRDDGVVVAEFGLDVGAGPLGLTSAQVHETFRYDDGLIREIVADIRIGG